MTGVRISEEFINSIRFDFPDLLIIVDGTQFCETAPFNFNNSGIDALIPSGYNWDAGWTS